MMHSRPKPPEDGPTDEVAAAVVLADTATARKRRTNVTSVFKGGRTAMSRLDAKSEELDAGIDGGKLLKSVYFIHRFARFYSKCDQSGLHYMPVHSHRT
jgi:hypothetical protein